MGHGPSATSTAGRNWHRATGTAGWVSEAAWEATELPVGRMGCLTWRGLRPLHLGVVVEAGGDVRVIVGVGHVGPEQELVDIGRGRGARGADQARRLTSSTEADWGGRSLGGPGGAGARPFGGGRRCSKHASGAQ